MNDSCIIKETFLKLDKLSFKAQVDKIRYLLTNYPDIINDRNYINWCVENAYRISSKKGNKMINKTLNLISNLEKEKLND
jgi:hypothetical protein